MVVWEAFNLRNLTHAQGQYRPNVSNVRMMRCINTVPTYWPPVPLNWQFGFGMTVLLLDGRDWQCNNCRGFSKLN
jgi:hypothetical protein